MSSRNTIFGAVGNTKAARRQNLTSILNRAKYFSLHNSSCQRSRHDTAKEHVLAPQDCLLGWSLNALGRYSTYCWGPGKNSSGSTPLQSASSSKDSGLRRSTGFQDRSRQARRSTPLIQKNPKGSKYAIFRARRRRLPESLLLARPIMICF